MKPSFLLAIALVFATGIAHAQDVFRVYKNARYGTLTRYPANLVTPQPESENGDGRKFLSRDGQIEVTSYAFRNLAARSARGEMNRAISDWKRDSARLTYSHSGQSWFVLSGFIGADIFYEKTLLQNGVFHTLIWQYPQSLKKRLDPVLSRSALSFSVVKSRSTTPKTVENRQPRAKPRPRRTARPLPTPRPQENRAGY